MPSLPAPCSRQGKFSYTQLKLNRDDFKVSLGSEIISSTLKILQNYRFLGVEKGKMLFFFNPSYKMVTYPEFFLCTSIKIDGKTLVAFDLDAYHLLYLYFYKLISFFYRSLYHSCQYPSCMLGDLTYVKSFLKDFEIHGDKRCYINLFIYLFICIFKQWNCVAPIIHEHLDVCRQHFCCCACLITLFSWGTHTKKPKFQ